MAREFRRDLCEYPKLDTVQKVYEYVRELPYREDPPGMEFVSRPSFTLWTEWNGPRDCDDKTLAIGAWCNLFGVPWRVVCAGESMNPDQNPHHIYPEVFTGLVDARGAIRSATGWTPADATYQRCEFGKLLYTERFREVYAA